MIKNEKKVVIVGAGIMGASIAYHLSQLGVNVTVLDRHQPASGATGSAFGWITSAVSDDAPDVFLRRASVSDWKRLAAEIPELWINWKGVINYADSPDSALADKVSINQTTIARMEPALNTPPEQALYVENDGIIDPSNATSILLARAEQMGARLIYHTRVQAIIRDQDKVTGVETSAGRMSADCIILACGTGIPELADLTGTTIPVISSPAILLRISTPDPVVNAIIAGDDMEVRHAQNGDLLAAEDYPENGDVEAVAHAAIVAIRNRLKGAEHGTLIRSSVGLRPTPADGYPVIGFIDDHQGIYVAVMHPAVTCAATLGRLISDELITGNSGNIPDVYRPLRFRPEQ